MDPDSKAQAFTLILEMKTGKESKFWIRTLKS